MSHAATAPRSAARVRMATLRARVAILSAAVLIALALGLAVKPLHAAEGAAKGPSDTTVTIKAFPPSVQVDTDAKDDSGSSAKDSAGGAPDARKRSHWRFDDDEDFDAVVEKMPWLIGLIFLVVASIFLTPLVLLIGIIWYKLRKTRLTNEAMLKLAEKGVVPPAHAAEALAAGAAPATVAPQLYQQAVEIRKRAVWSDLRKGVILSGLGLALSFYELVSGGGASWVGLVLLFVGVGYVVLWWLEGRHLDAAKSSAGGNAGQPGTSGS